MYVCVCTHTYKHKHRVLKQPSTCVYRICVLHAMYASSCVNLHVPIFIYRHINVYLYLYICIYVYILCAQKDAYVRLCICENVMSTVRVYIGDTSCVCVRVYVYVHASTHVCVCLH